MRTRKKIFAAVATALVLGLVMPPTTAGPRTRRIGTRTYEISGFVRTNVGDPSCNSRRVADLLPPQVPSTERGKVRSTLPAKCVVTTDGSIDHGGIVFPAIGGRSRTAYVKLAIVDEIGISPKVAFTLCQNIDGDSVCGESRDDLNPDQVSEPSYRGCSPGFNQIMKVSTRYPINIFVRAASTGCTFIDEAEDLFVATRGKVTLTQYFL